MNFEMLFHLPFIFIIALLVYWLSHKIRDSIMSAFLYYTLLFAASIIIYLVLFVGLVYITTESSSF